ncbi:MAG: T9SS type A sorting domain-containing protein [Bacteroidota bacterium]|nr:T9SS type A sorting domain-containing protein [Bacteroidota bacterium]
MKKHLFIIIQFIWLISLNCLAQSYRWVPVGAGLGLTGVGRCMAVYNNELYVGGDFVKMLNGPGNRIAKWDGTSWYEIAGFDKTVRTLAVYKGELYAGGEFTLAGTDTIYYIARWNGSTWKKLGPGLAKTTGKVYSLKVVDSILYVGGNQTRVNGTLYGNAIMKWNGTNWSDFSGNGVYGEYAEFVDGSVIAIDTVFSRFVVAGVFGSVGNGPFNVGNIAQWGGVDTFGIPFSGTWYNIGSRLNNHFGIYGFSQSTSTVYAMKNYLGKLYIAGNCGLINSLRDTVGYLAAYNGIDLLKAGPGKFDNPANTLHVYNGLLYIGGDFMKTNGDTVNCVVTWDGSKWGNLDKGLKMSFTSGQVYAITDYKGSIYATGNFNANSRGTAMASIGRWTSITGNTEINQYAVQVKIFPNPNKQLLNVEFETSESKNISIILFDANGRNIMQEKFSADTGNQTFQINTSPLVPGIYFLYIQDENHYSVSKQKLVIF